MTANGAEPGLVIQTQVNPALSGTSFTLDDGASFTFSFFNVWTNEPKIETDDLVASPISATLNFDSPLTGTAVNGITVGGSWYKGLSQWGQLTWNGPVTISLPGDRTFQITLSDATFNYGLGGTQEGLAGCATVEATVKQISSPVPDGGRTALLLGTALSVLGIAARVRGRTA